MPTGFVMMLSSNREPDPVAQVEALLGQSQQTGRAYFLCRKRIDPDRFEKDVSKVGLLGDQSAENRMLAVGTYMRAFNVGQLGRPGKPRMEDILPMYQEVIAKDRSALKQVIELKDFLVCGEEVTLAGLGWTTESQGDDNVPESQGGSYFLVNHG